MSNTNILTPETMLDALVNIQHQIGDAFVAFTNEGNPPLCQKRLLIVRDSVNGLINRLSEQC